MEEQEEQEEEEEEGWRGERKGGGGGSERTRGTGGEKNEKERGMVRRIEVPMPADAVEPILCSIHCVMAASSCNSQSQLSCHL